MNLTKLQTIVSMYKKLIFLYTSQQLRNKKNAGGYGDMAQWLREFPALAEDQSLIPITHTGSS